MAYTDGHLCTGANAFSVNSNKLPTRFIARFKRPHELRAWLIGQLSKNRDARELIPPVELLQREGHPWLVSVNFSHDKHQSPSEPADVFRHRVQENIRYHMKKVGAGLFLFVLEYEGARWHLHGVVAYSGPRDRLRDALVGVAGRSAARKPGAKLVHVQDVDYAKGYGGATGIRGWALYIGKSLTKSSSQLGKTPVIASRGLKALMNRETGQRGLEALERRLHKVKTRVTQDQLDDPNWGIF